jgi:hypothetical protein
LRANQTTFQRAIKEAKRLQPETNQVNNSFFFNVASTSIEDGRHYVELGPNKFNPFFDSKCDCGGANRYRSCLHIASAFLKYTANLECRCDKGYNILHSSDISPETYQAAEDLFVDLLDKYTRCLDLLRAIDEGFDITQPQFREAYRHLLNPLTDQLLLTA